MEAAVKLAISNIAWDPSEDVLVAEAMRRHEVDGVEIAPTTRWPRPLEASEEDARALRAFWNDRGIRVVALQALLYGRPDLVVFGDTEARSATLAYLDGIARLGSWLDARVLVFGSPKNRAAGALPPERAQEIALEFFAAAGASAASHGVVLCIEPNPPAYGCDFVTTAAEGLALVERVGSPGFGLHLDAAGMHLACDPTVETLERCAGALCHFHVSEPRLGPIGEPGQGGERGVDHALLGSTLAGLGYDGRCSVEMRRVPERDTASEIDRVLGLLHASYGEPAGDAAEGG